MSRSSVYGSPFKNLNSGRDETSDKENTKRLKEAFNNYHQSEEGKENLKHFEDVGISKTRVQITNYLGPVTGLLCGKFTADAFCAPRSIYMKAMLMFGFTTLGYWYSLHVYESQKVSHLYKNFYRYPIELQQALRSNDSRYSRKWNSVDQS